MLPNLSVETVEIDTMFFRTSWKYESKALNNLTSIDPDFEKFILGKLRMCIKINCQGFLLFLKKYSSVF